LGWQEIHGSEQLSIEAFACLEQPKRRVKPSLVNGCTENHELDYLPTLCSVLTSEILNKQQTDRLQFFHLISFFCTLKMGYNSDHFFCRIQNMIGCTGNSVSVGMIIMQSLPMNN